MGAPGDDSLPQRTRRGASLGSLFEVFKPRKKVAQRSTTIPGSGYEPILSKPGLGDRFRPDEAMSVSRTRVEATFTHDAGDRRARMAILLARDSFSQHRRPNQEGSLSNLGERALSPIVPARKLCGGPVLVALTAAGNWSSWAGAETNSAFGTFLQRRLSRCLGV